MKFYYFLQTKKLFKKEYIKPLCFIAATFCLCPESAYALRQGAADGAAAIHGIDQIWATIQPYLTGLFSVGGVIYSGLNIRKVVIGDYRAAAPAALSALMAGLGINGMFGQNALSVLLP